VQLLTSDELMPLLAPGRNPKLTAGLRWSFFRAFAIALDLRLRLDTAGREEFVSYTERQKHYAKIESERKTKILTFVTSDRQGMETAIAQDCIDLFVDGEPTAEDEGSFVPLQIFAEGDSWFDYPVAFFGGSIIPRLERRLGVPILNLAKAGDEARYMLGVEERAILTEHLTNGCPAGGPWDVLLFSGGGNDILGNSMALWVSDWNPARVASALPHSEGIAYKPPCGEIAMCLRVGWMGPIK
jgi:hypothetical protein